MASLPIACGSLPPLFPGNADATHITLPAITKASLSNGPSVYMASDSDCPIVAVGMAIRAGHGYDPLGELGMASLVSSVLLDGVGGGDRIALHRRYAEIGATPDAFVTPELLGITTVVRREDLRTTLQLLAENLREPTLSPAAFELQQVRHRIHMHAMAGDMEAVAGLGLILAELGVEPAIGTLASGIPINVESLNIERARAWLTAFVRPDSVTIVLAGGLVEHEVIEWSKEVTRTWPISAASLPSTPVRTPAPVHLRPHTTFVAWPRGGQGLIAYGGRRQPVAKTGVVQTLADDLIDSVVNHELRTLKRITYGIKSSTWHTKHGLLSQKSVIVNAAEVGRAAQRIRALLLRQRSSDLRDDAVAKIQRRAMTGLMVDLHGPERILKRLLDLAETNRYPQAYDDQFEVLRSLDAGTLTSAMASSYSNDSFRMALVASPESLDYARQTLPTEDTVDRSPLELCGFDPIDESSQPT